MKGLKLALYYLGRRDRTEKELREKLEAKEIPPQEIEAVFQKLKSYGYLDDTAYAKKYQSSKNSYKPTGQRRLKMELYKKGVPKEIIETVESTPENEYRLACEAAEAQMRRYQRLDQETAQRRLMAFLARRGFDYGTIKKVLDQPSK